LAARASAFLFFPEDFVFRIHAVLGRYGMDELGRIGPENANAVHHDRQTLLFTYRICGFAARQLLKKVVTAMLQRIYIKNIKGIRWRSSAME